MAFFDQWFGQFFGQFFGASSGDVTASVDCGTYTETGFDCTATTNETIVVYPPRVVLSDFIHTRRLQWNVTAEVDVARERVIGFDVAVSTSSRVIVSVGSIGLKIAQPAGRASAKARLGTGSLRCYTMDCEVSAVDFDLQLAALLAIESEL